MKKQTRSILSELQSFLPAESKEIVIGNRANHIIESAVNLLELISRHYAPEQAAELEKKLLSSIKNRDAKRFERHIKKLKETPGE
jgi:hypothetical protein